MNITRQQQLLSLIKRIISTELLELNHEELHGAVVTSVLLSNDGRECRVWIDASESTIKSLNTTYRYDIQHAFMKKYMRKVVPKLQFLKDQGDIETVEALLEDPEINA